jgi:hypothetical protein
VNPVSSQNLLIVTSRTMMPIPAVDLPGREYPETKWPPEEGLAELKTVVRQTKLR